MEEKVEGDKQVEAANGDGDWEDWAAPVPLIESNLSGSDYKEACCNRYRGSYPLSMCLLSIT